MRNRPRGRRESRALRSRPGPSRSWPLPAVAPDPRAHPGRQRHSWRHHTQAVPGRRSAAGMSDVTSASERAFEGLLDAVRDSGRMVRGERGGVGADAQADGYRYALELLRLAIDFYCDQDWSTPRFI